MNVVPPPPPSLGELEKLPAELRNRIYRFVFAAKSKPLVLHAATDPVTSPLAQHYGHQKSNALVARSYVYLSLTSRAIKQEAAPVFFATVHIIIRTKHHSEISHHMKPVDIVRVNLSHCRHITVEGKLWRRYKSDSSLPAAGETWKCLRGSVADLSPYSIWAKADLRLCGDAGGLRSYEVAASVTFVRKWTENEQVFRMEEVEQKAAEILEETVVRKRAVTLPVLRDIMQCIELQDWGLFWGHTATEVYEGWCV